MSNKVRRLIEEGKAPSRAEIKALCQPVFKRDKDGNPIYVTQQSHKKECDINEIIKRHDKNGLIVHVNKLEGQFGDFTNFDFKTMEDTVARAKSMFNMLPGKVKDYFDQEPGKLLDFLDDPANKEEAIKMGLIRADGKEGPQTIPEPVVEPVAQMAEGQEVGEQRQVASPGASAPESGENPT